MGKFQSEFLKILLNFKRAYKQEGGLVDKANCFKLKEGKCRLDVRWKFFYSEGDEVLAQAAQRSYGATSLEAFKGRLHGALGSLIW